VLTFFADALDHELLRSRRVWAGNWRVRKKKKKNTAASTAQLRRLPEVRAGQAATNVQRKRPWRWLSKIPRAELQQQAEVHAGQNQMRKDSTKEGGFSRSQQNFGDYQKCMQDRNKCTKTAPRKVAFQREFWQMPETLDA